MVTHITENTSFRKAVKKRPVVVIDFYAEWCGPCKTIAPVIEEWERVMAGTRDGDLVMFLKCDVDEISSLAEKLEISCMPTFLIYQHGTLFKRVEGADVPALRRAIEKAMESVDEI